MDVIEAHVRRLPPLDDRWWPRAQDAAALAEALLEGGVAGTATHPLDNVRGNALMLLEGDPDKLFGFDADLPAGLDLDDVLAIVETGAGARHRPGRPIRAGRHPSRTDPGGMRRAGRSPRGGVPTRRDR